MNISGHENTIVSCILILILALISLSDRLDDWTFKGKK